VNEYYPQDLNYIYIYRSENNGDIRNTIEGNNIEYTTDLFSSVELAKLEGRGKLFIHGFYLPHFVKYALAATEVISKNSLVLVIYGADLYNNRYLLQDNFFHPGIWVQEYQKKRLIRRIGNFMTFASSDYDLLHEWYGANGKQYDCLYPSNANIELLSKIRGETNNDRAVRILLGNSATVTNRHEEALGWLERYKNNDIRIICPLSYGDMEYGNRVEDYGRSIFGENFIPIRNYMGIDEYSLLLNSVDIAIYNNNRQQATGNIEILGYLGKKIFVRSDTTT